MALAANSGWGIKQGIKTCQLQGFVLWFAIYSLLTQGGIWGLQ